MAGATKSLELDRCRLAGRIIATLLWLTTTTCTAPQRRPPADAPAAESVIEQALPGVVLLLTANKDGKLGYGTGMLIDDHGRVLTSLHVVAGATSVGALLYDPHRVSYSSIDGGLARYRFQHQQQIIAGSLERGDPVRDLAIVRLDVETRAYPKLKLRSQPPSRGEAVFALGHPKESVWSFTKGIVSSFHQGIIQHDAAINPGNSGGPLIDEQGRVVGINFYRVGADGIGYARTAEMARELITGVTTAFVPDLSSPTNAVISCQRAYELASPSALDCFDWTGGRDEGLRELKTRLDEGRLSAAQSDRALASARAHLERIFSALKQIVLASIVHGSTRGLVEEASGIRYTVNDGGSAGDEDFEQLLVARRQLVQRLKLGLRVDQVKLDQSRAWVALTGRHLDGSTYQFSELWTHAQDGWKRPIFKLRDPPPLPARWAAPLSDGEELLSAGQVTFDGAQIGPSSDGGSTVTFTFSSNFSGPDRPRDGGR